MQEIEANLGDSIGSELPLVACRKTNLCNVCYNDVLPWTSRVLPYKHVENEKYKQKTCPKKIRTQINSKKSGVDWIQHLNYLA